MSPEYCPRHVAPIYFARVTHPLAANECSHTSLEQVGRRFCKIGGHLTAAMQTTKFPYRRRHREPVYHDGDSIRANEATFTSPVVDHQQHHTGTALCPQWHAGDLSAAPGPTPHRLPRPPPGQSLEPESLEPESLESESLELTLWQLRDGGERLSASLRELREYTELIEFRVLELEALREKVPSHYVR